MTTQAVIVPTMGESIREGIIARLLVAEGAQVAVDQPIIELETEKISTEIPASAAGAVHFTVKEGDTVPIGTVVAEIDTNAVAASPKAGEAKAAYKSEAKPAEAATKPAGANPALSPSVRKLVSEHQLDTARIPGTGKDGLVTKGDVLALLEETKAAPPATPASTPAPAQPAPIIPAAPAGIMRKRMSAMRARIAQRLVAAQHTAAILTTFNEIDLQTVIDSRKRHKEEFEQKHGVGLGFMSFFVRATVEALKKYPQINNQIDGQDIVSFDGVHLGIAVGTEKGLVVPVLRHAERLAFADIERAIKEFALKARENRLAVEDMQGGTFTITNGGVYGSLMSTPIVNPPQSGILGMHAIKERPIALNGQVVIRPMMYVALSYDHRIVDGAEAVGFLVRVKELIESPDRLLLGL